MSTTYTRRTIIQIMPAEPGWMSCFFSDGEKDHLYMQEVHMWALVEEQTFDGVSNRSVMRDGLPMRYVAPMSSSIGDGVAMSDDGEGSSFLGCVPPEGRHDRDGYMQTVRSEIAIRLPVKP